jgi:excisionase family DNA binding protein
MHPLIPATLSVTEAAALAGVHRRTMQRWVRKGYVLAYRRPGSWRVDRDALLTMLSKTVAA